MDRRRACGSARLGPDGRNETPPEPTDEEGQTLANHKSAEKRARQDERRHARNRAMKSEVRTRFKSVRAAIEAGDASKAAEDLRKAERSMRKATSKGVFKASTTSRSVSRLARAVHAIPPT